MVLQRRVWAGLAAALPAVLVSLRFIDVYFDPDAGTNREWAEDANLLVKLEFLLLFVAAFTAWFTGLLATALRGVGAISAFAAVFGALVYGLWVATDGSQVIFGAGLLVAGRFLSAVIAGPEAAAELGERAVMGALFYLVILFVVFGLPDMLPYGRTIHIARPAAAFCALYFLLLALAEAAHIYVGTPEAVSRRPTVKLGGSGALTQSSLVLRFAGDAFEIVSFSRMRAAGRILAFFISLGPLGIGLLLLRADQDHRHFSILPVLIGLFLLALGCFLAFQSLRMRASTSILQVRPGGMVMLELTDGKLDTALELTSAEIGFEVLRGEHSYIALAVTRKTGDETLMLVGEGLQDEAAAGSLRHLFELYLSGEASPDGLRKALDADAGLAALLGPDVIGRLLAATPIPVHGGLIACHGCGEEIVANAPHCPYCGLLYPAQDR